MTLLEIILGVWAVVATILFFIVWITFRQYADRLLERDLREMDVIILKRKDLKEEAET